jgi:hypothetical protein
MDTGDAGDGQPRGEHVPPPELQATAGRPRAGSIRYGFALLALALLALALYLTLHGSAARRNRSLAGVGAEAAPASPRRLRACGAVCDPIDPAYLTDLPFARTSFWLQPWRSYFDTWPASRLLGAVGANFDVEPAQALATARVLHDFGFRLARVATTWGAISYDDPTHFTLESSLRVRLLALRAYGLRPLIVLDSSSGDPAPARTAILETLAPAPAGATTVTLSPSSAATVVPGRTGFSAGGFSLVPRPRRLRRGGAPADRALTAVQRAAVRAGTSRLAPHGGPEILITKVGPGGTATLSRPLPLALPAGPHNGRTLRFAPFGPPKLADGSPNHTFAETLRGWLDYVAAVSRIAREIFGAGGYDLEIWNGQSSGSGFLGAARYYSHPRTAASRKAITTAGREVQRALLDATVAYVRDPANGASTGVGVSDGFASRTPFPSGAQAPAGLTALSKQPYLGGTTYPAEYPRQGRPVNALGERDTSAHGSHTPKFIPRYRLLQPEAALAGTSAGYLTRDLAPITTKVYGFPHGRAVGPPGGAPLQKWVTEYNLSPNVSPVGPDEVTPEPSVVLSPAEEAHFHAKALLRSLVAMVNKGASREYFFAAGPGSFTLIGAGFSSALQARPHAYPGDALAGEILTAFRNMLVRFHGPGPGGAARRLKLISITQEGDHAQFSGDGTPAHPRLYDREVLAVLPFQSSPTRFVIPIYVMTSDLLTDYMPGSNGITRFDLPPENFRVTLGNLPATTTAPTVSAYDPLRNRPTPARIIARAGETATFEIAATDYPRLLSIEYGGHA